jgi:hypothetical protein
VAPTTASLGGTFSYGAFSYGVVYDFLYTDNFGEEADEIQLSQLRAQRGLSVTPVDELGVWGAARLSKDTAESLGGGVEVWPIDQLNLYWRRWWQLGGETMFYFGFATEPGDLVFGLRGDVPLGEFTSAYGSLAYLLPSTSGGDVLPNGVDNSFAEETWNVSFGLALYTHPLTRRPRRFLPLLPVADNGTFAIRAPNGGL